MAQFPDTIYDDDFSARYGLPAGTKLIGPPIQGSILAAPPGTPEGRSKLLAYDGPWPPPKREAPRPPPPSAPSPPPPELIPDTGEAITVCLSPDVCRSPEKPVPYMAWGKASDDQNYSPDGRSNGQVIKRHDSVFSCCYGDEPGVGLGCQSNTVGDIVEPVTSSSVVRANGVWVQRHNDRCTLNSGNTVGEYLHVKSTESHPAPDAADAEDKAWYEKAWDWTGERIGEAGQAIHEFDQSHGKIVTRGVGALQAVGGGVEAAAGAALATGGGAATATGIGAAPGVPAMIGGGLLAVNGYDNFQAGLKQAWTGETQTTMIAQGAGQIAGGLGASPGTVQSVENTVGMVQGVAGITGTAAAAMRTTGKLAAAEKGAASLSDDAARAATQTGAKETDEAAAAAARSTEDGSAGARSTRPPSLRDQYLGSTPGKTSRTGREVRERMRADGQVRENPLTGKDEFLDENGTWRPVDSPQTHMGHHPMDAVDYWNQTGRYSGAKSPEVRDWMLKSDNYQFEWGPLNSARGGATRSRYLPPVGN